MPTPRRATAVTAIRCQESYIHVAKRGASVDPPQIQEFAFRAVNGLFTLFFPSNFLKNSHLHDHLGKHLHQVPVIVLTHLHLADHGCIHAAILRPPLTKARAPSQGLRCKSLLGSGVMPCLRQSSGTGMPSSASRKIAKICSPSLDSPHADCRENSTDEPCQPRGDYWVRNRALTSRQR